MISPAEAPVIPEPPLPSGQAVQDRWRHTRLRRRMLTGRWDNDLRDLVNQAAGTKRASAWKMVDLSANLFRSSWTQLAVQYDREPFVLHADAAGLELANLLRKSLFWQLMPRVQRDTLGLREMLVRVDVAGGRPLYRPVSPDYVTAEASPDDPGRPIALREALLRDRGSECRWTWDSWDITDPAKPRVQVVDERGKDVSREYLRRADGSPAPEGGLSGDDYTWVDDDGAPYIPYAWYHAQHTAQLFDPYEGRELVAGSLNVALLWSFYGHVLRNAAWAQKYGINVRPIGTQQVGDEDNQRQVQQLDPATIQLFEADDATGQPIVAQFQTVVDPMVMAESIALYQRQLAASTGILAPSDAMRVAGDPRSGYALAISREGQREAQQRWETQFRVGDEEVLRITALLLNRETDSDYPVEDYEVRYQTVPLSSEEREAQRRHILELLDAGMIDRVQAYQTFHPGLSDADAVEELERIATVNRTVAAPADVDKDGATVPATEVAVQDTALNGAQVSSLLQVVQAVAARQLPRASAVGIIRRAFSVDEADAEAMLGEVGDSFFIDAPAAQGVNVG